MKLALKRQGPHWEKTFYKLAAEYANEKCRFQWNDSGAIERIVNVVALQLEVPETGSLLVVLGSWIQGKVNPTCMLPGTKQSNNETPEEAISRLLKQEYAVLGNHVKLGSCQSRAHWKTSPSCGFRTKYVRSVISAKLEAPPESIHFVKAAPKGAQGAERGDQDRLPREGGQQTLKPLRSTPRRLQRAPTRHGERDPLPQLLPNSVSYTAPEMYLVWHGTGEEIDLVAWLTQEEYDLVRSLDGERQLKVWLSSIAVDPTLMQPNLRRT